MAASSLDLLVPFVKPTDNPDRQVRTINTIARILNGMILNGQLTRTGQDAWALGGGGGPALPVSSGGTGDTTLTPHSVLIGEGTNPVAFAGPGATSGVPLVAQGAAADPVFGTAVVAGGGTGQTTLTNHGVLVGAGTNAVTQLAVGATRSVLQGTTGADPAFTTTPLVTSLSAGNANGITPLSVTNGSGTTVFSIATAKSGNAVFQVSNKSAVQVFSIDSAGGTVNVGAAGTATGSFVLFGTTSGNITIQPQAAAGVYNFNLPTTAGSTGDVLTSQGGGASAMTWTSPASLGVALTVGSTAVNSGTSGRVLYDNAGVLGEMTTTGTGTVIVLQTAPTFAGSTLTLADPQDLVLGTSTGTKVGTAAAQKLGFWNAAPVVQPTTAGGTATRVGGGGATVTDTDTFDGYTLGQVVKALRTVGILA